MNDLRQAVEDPSLYLYNYFYEIRNKVDVECSTKQIEYENDEAKKQKLDKIWEEIIAKINSFEKICLNNKIIDVKGMKKRLDSIETALNGGLNLNATESHLHSTERTLPNNTLENIKNNIEIEKTKCLKELFQNRTIDYVRDHNSKKDDLINCKLVILKDEFLNDQSMQLAG